MIRLVRSALLVLGVTVSTLVGAQEAPRSPETLEGASLQREIDRAIERGVTALSDSIGDDDTSNTMLQRYPMGYRSLIAYALLESGESPRANRVRELFADAMRSREKNVYSVSLALLALDTLAEVGDLSKSQRDRMTEMAAWLVGIQRKNGYWGYGNEPPSNPWSDLSNTQFATLGLAAAGRRGCTVPERTWLRVQETLKRSSLDLGDPRPLWFEGVGWGATIPDASQEGERSGTTPDPTLLTPIGWGYTAERVEATPSMISAGVSTLLLARDRVGEKHHATIDARLKGALVGLTLRFLDVAPAPTDTVHRNYYYTIYSLEKALDLAGCERIGGTDWYEHHARILLREQRPDGFWGPRSSSTQFRRTSSAFALLFLNRATLRHRIRIVTGAGSVEEYGYDKGRVLRPGGRRAVDLDDLFDQLAETSSQRLEEIAREIVERATRFERPYLLSRLSTLRRDGEPKLAQWALAEQCEITGLSSDSATLEAVDAWFSQWQAIQTVREGKPADADRRLAAIWDPTPNAKLRSYVLDAWSALGRFESSPFIIERLESMDSDLLARAHETLVRLTGQRELADTEPGTIVSVWTVYWRNHGKERRDDSVFRELAAALERAATPEETETARAAIVALGESAISRVDAEIAKDRFRVDWLIIRERITGERRGF